MQTPHSSYSHPSEPAEARVLVEALRLTRSSNQQANLDAIGEYSGATSEAVRAVLESYLDLGGSKAITIDPRTRFVIAQRAVQLGALEQVAQALTWQEFEAFAEDCLVSVGFQTWKGLVVKDARRRWQVDLAAQKGPMVLSIDCKHWNSPSYPSKFRGAAAHQKLALSPLMRRLKSESGLESARWALPVVLTLLDPRSKTLDEAVLVSVLQFSDFLEHVTPYDSDLPFVSMDDLGESSISQHHSEVLDSY